MSDYNIITEMLEMEMPNLLRKDLEELQKEAGTHTNAQQLLALCRVFTAKVEIAKSERQYYGNSYYSSKKIGAGKRIKKEELMVYGARLNYAIRQFLTGEEIVFHIGARVGGQYGSDAFVSQKDVMKNFSRIGRNAIGLTHAIERMLIENSQEKSDELFVNKWKIIEQLVNVQNEPYNKNSVKQVGWDSKENRAIYAYQKQKADFKVYIKFSGKNHRRSKYYDLNGGLVGFNNGWLWEWYDSIYNSGNVELLEQVHQSIGAGSIKPLFLGFDRTPGLKQGDYMDKKGRQIQNKYDNMQIISYNNILKVLYELTPALEVFVANNDNQQAAENLLAILKDNFIPETALAVGKMAEETIENELLSKLKAFAT